MGEALGMDFLCVGSPGPMALFGHKSMNTVEFQEQLYFLEAVLRGASTPFICCNMPNTTACVSKADAVRNASEIQRRGADGVHIEPHHKTVKMVEVIVAAGIPVVGHFGVQGERWSQVGSYLPRGRTAKDAADIVKLIKSCIDAGISTVLLEYASEELTKWCFENLSVPVASLGSGPHAHGIFHVSSDIIGSRRWCRADAAGCIRRRAIHDPAPVQVLPRRDSARRSRRRTPAARDEYSL